MITHHRKTRIISQKIIIHTYIEIMLESCENQSMPCQSVSANIRCKPGDGNQGKMICQPESPNVTCTAEPIAHHFNPAHESEPPNVVYTIGWV